MDLKYRSKHRNVKQRNRLQVFFLPPLVSEFKTVTGTRFKSLQVWILYSFLIYLTATAVTRADSVASNGKRKVNNKLKKMWKQNVVKFFWEYLITPRRTSAIIVDVTKDVLTSNLRKVTQTEPASSVQIWRNETPKNQLWKYRALMTSSVANR